VHSYQILYCKRLPVCDPYHTQEKHRGPAENLRIMGVVSRRSQSGGVLGVDAHVFATQVSCQKTQARPPSPKLNANIAGRQ
jgi:hypothetical protein